MIAINLNGLQTEERNPNSIDIDRVSTEELCQIINREDATVAQVVENCIPVISAAIDALTGRVRKGGRVIYVGAGTSGRLGILDASEIPPTYSSPYGQFVGLIAGGDAALRFAQEGAEDDVHAAVRDLEALKLDGEVDSIIGIAASGRTPYVLSCLEYGKSLGCVTIGVACTAPSAMSTCGYVDYMISAVTGPEVVTGSTRMKAGTATKLILNMLSSGVMIKIGKTFGNMMVDLKATNIKLQQRSRNILRTLGGDDSPDSDEQLDDLLKNCNGSVKLALAKLKLQTTVEEAKAQLDASDGVLAHLFTTVDSADKPTGSLTDINNKDEYVLCIDGGGSKCAAVIMAKDGSSGYGEGGSCNVTDVGIESAISEISLAIQKAVDSFHGTVQRPFDPSEYTSIFVGLAGYDRPGISEKVNSSLSLMFKRPLGRYLKITNDIELLASSTAGKYGLDSAIVIVAGTGSVAMCYERRGDQFVRTGRSGGWGHILGDDGSGFDIGRQGVRLALAELEERNLLQSTISNDELVKPLDPCTTKVLQHFNPGGDDLEYDLLSEILAPSTGTTKQYSEQNHKRRIAEVAQVVITACLTSEKAQSIIEHGTQSLIAMLKRLLQSGKIDLSHSVLVLAGGMMQSNHYQERFKQELMKASMDFGKIELVQQPAMIGSQFLLKQLMEKNQINENPGAVLCT